MGSDEPLPENNSEKPLDHNTEGTVENEQKTNTLETHAHHLHHAPGKKFWHYFYEFLMLFLAVFAGFLAENQREHFVEGKREKEFMVSLVKDLQLDMDHFSRIRAYRLEKIRTMDSLIVFFARDPGVQLPATGYSMASKLFGHMAFYQNSGTLDQLKSAGGFRLIRKRNVVDSIESYDQQTRRIAARDIFETNFSVDNSAILQKLFDGRALLKIHADTTYFHKPADPTAQIKVNEQYLGEYVNSLIHFQTMVVRNLDLQSVVREKAARLIGLIKKEYDLQ